MKEPIEGWVNTFTCDQKEYVWHHLYKTKEAADGDAPANRVRCVKVVEEVELTEGEKIASDALRRTILKSIDKWAAKHKREGGKMKQ